MAKPTIINAMAVEVADCEPIQITVDSEGLKHDLLPWLRQQVDNSGLIIDEHRRALVPARKVDLGKLVMRVARLPEQFELEPGTTLFVGENGSGKTTLASAIAIAARFTARVRYLKTAGYQDAEAKARDEVYDNPVDRRDQPSFLHLYKFHGLAPYVAKYLSADIPETMNGLFYDVDLASIAPPSRERQKRGTFWHEGGKEKLTDFLYGQSHRQDIEDEAHKWMRAQHWAQKRDPHCLIIDEPEIGISPWRHQNIVQEMAALVTELDYNPQFTLVPTNSPVLYFDHGDIPRINLEDPGRGVHTLAA